VCPFPARVQQISAGRFAIAVARATTEGIIRAVHGEPLRTRLLRLVWLATGRKDSVDRLLTTLLRYRRYLPECDAQVVIPRFQETEVRIRQCPLGAWSTPLADVFVLLKAALGFGSKRILELGSFRGETAKLLAENTGPDTTVCAVDVDERHGESYRGLPVAARIQRKVGRITPELFAPAEKYDLIFVDANHDFASVMNDTAVAFGVLAQPGVILWHDYQHISYFHDMAGVPEALNRFATRYALCAIRGTVLAIYSNVPGWETARLKPCLPTPQQGRGL
jgi:predicted O-methyltransferase YrrM